MKSWKHIPRLPGVYKLTNKINGKIYIGKSISLRRRLMEHQYERRDAYPIERAIKKYGMDNFEIEVLHQEINIDNLCLLAIESAYIEFFNSTDKNLGYNVLQFGGGDRTGIPHSQETKNKISIANKGKVSHNKRPIKQINITTGELIKVWPSMKEAAAGMGIRNYQEIYRVCKNIRPRCHGFKWQYAKEKSL